MALAPTPIDAQPLRRLGGGLLLAWIAFWLMMMAVGLQEHLRDGSPYLWRPVIAEGSSMLVATAVALVQWRLSKRLDPLLSQPRRWFMRVLAWTPLVAIGFVLVVHGIRTGAFTLLHIPRPRDPWPAALLYESLKFAIFYVLFTGVQFGVRSYLAYSAERLEAERQRTLSQQAQLLQLTQQLQPHFLFNALNTVSSLIHSDPDLADALLTQLASLLRAASDAQRRPQQTLAEELTLLDAYAGIMIARFGDRVRIDWHIEPAARRCEVPTLALQPLLENCFRHVVEPRRETTHIVVSARCREGRLAVEVADDGGRLAAAAAFGVGLRNLEQRTRMLHGDAASLVLSQNEGGGVSARLEMPCAC
ncbi:histidine kinase [Piscinibacter sp. XHJ-5]|uniref:sensor histidine kinase n=1 Tax=Piscinibacter sp. XHJ-5 TaxID=3037797 RepID=UPI00245294D7|nr:histidine kinase [Piscinibacter sp. XHJ-5]